MPLSAYEIMRAKKMAENRKRLIALGIIQAVAAVKQAHKACAPKPKPRRKRAPRDMHRAAAAADRRPRSRRIAGRKAVVYNEKALEALGLGGMNASAGCATMDALDALRAKLRTGVRPKDVYTVANLNALGACLVPYAAHPHRLAACVPGLKRFGEYAFD